MSIGIETPASRNELCKKNPAFVNGLNYSG
jgi:hypothetical protein